MNVNLIVLALFIRFYHYLHLVVLAHLQQNYEKMKLAKIDQITEFPRLGSAYTFFFLISNPVA